MENKKRINKDELKNVVGGFYEEPEHDDLGIFHKGCGGKLNNVNKWWKASTCAKCGYGYQWIDDFSHYSITYWYQEGSYCKYDENGNKIEETFTRPEELDWPCNQF